MEKFKRIIWRGILMPYEISDRGAVFRIAGPDKNGRWWSRSPIKATILPTGYLDILMRLDGKKYHALIHKLVADAFLPPCPGTYGRGGIAINHKNFDKTDNRFDNIEWTTYKNNTEHAIKHGLMAIGEKNPNSVLTEASVLAIRRRHAAGLSFRALANEFECSRFAISCVCKRVTWKHI